MKLKKNELVKILLPLKLHPLRTKKRQISLRSASLTELLECCLVNCLSDEEETRVKSKE